MAACVPVPPWGNLRSWTSSPTARALAVALGSSVPLALLVALSPRVGGDIVAQRWWAGWATGASGGPLDFGWYAGTPAVSYSLLSSWSMAVLGVTACGVLGTIGSTTALAVLFTRTAVRRPLTATALAALTCAASQLSGRTTFGLGTAAGLGALVLLTAATGRWWRRPGAAMLAALAGALSPVVAAFLLLAMTAWWIGGRGARARAIDAAWTVTGAGLPLAAMWLLGGADGEMVLGGRQALEMAACLVVMLLLLGRRQPVLTAGTALTLLALAAVWVLPDPIGSNITRLVLLFGVPVLVAVAPARPIRIALACLALVLLLPPLVPGDLIERSAPTASSRSGGLVAELDRREPIGRVEVVPLATHLESQVVAQRVPVARGWLRQLDIARNGLFYDGSLSPAGYREWLARRGVSYVALPVAHVDWPAHGEAGLVRSGLPYLRQVWSDRAWTLYSVGGSTGVVTGGPGTLLRSGRTGMTLRVSAPGTVQLALFWDRTLSLSGPAGCLQAGSPSGAVLLRARTAGTYRIGSAWFPRGHC